MSISEIITAFTTRPEYHDHNDQLHHFSGLSFEQAVDDAVFGRYIGKDGLQYLSNHYWRAFETTIPERADWPGRIYSARKRILEQGQLIRSLSDFDSIYNTIREVLERPKIGGLGSLYYYDVTLRIGFWFDPVITPDNLYVQSGSERGAKDLLGEDIYIALKADRPYIDPTQLYQLCEDFQQIEVHQIESLLCVMKEELQNWRRQN